MPLLNNYLLDNSLIDGPQAKPEIIQVSSSERSSIASQNYAQLYAPDGYDILSIFVNIYDAPLGYQFNMQGTCSAHLSEDQRSDAGLKPSRSLYSDSRWTVGLYSLNGVWRAQFYNSSSSQWYYMYSMICKLKK